MVRSDVPIYYSTDDLFDDLGCYAWGMARTHDGLMMLLTVGRNHALIFVIFCIGWLSLMNIVISFMLMNVTCM